MKLIILKCYILKVMDIWVKNIKNVFRYMKLKIIYIYNFNYVYM